MMKDETFVVSSWRRRGAPLMWVQAPLQISSIVWDEEQGKWVSHHYTEEELKAMKESRDGDKDS